jgi:peptide deformylase
MKNLRIRQAGDPILRQKAKRLSTKEVCSSETQLLIAELKSLVEGKNYGVGISAPQVGKSVALAVIGIKPTPNRPGLIKTDLIMINPVITNKYGKKIGMWEGCFSVICAKLFAKAMRYPKIKVKYINENAATKEELFEGFVAQVIQHEVDHLNGILFTDRIADLKTIMNSTEYRKMVKKDLV